MKFKSPKDLLEKGLAYFKGCEERKEPKTITGLALALSTTRKTLCEYEENESRPQYVNAVKRLKAIVEHELEVRALTANVPAGAIFLLKASFGYRDAMDINLEAKLKPTDYTEEEQSLLRELARLRAAKAITAGSVE